MEEAAFKYTVYTRRAPVPQSNGAVEYKRGPSPFPRRKMNSSWLERVDKISWEVVSWPLAARKADLLHSLYFAAPVIAPAPLIVTVHDAISLRAEHSHGGPAQLYGRFMKDAAKKATRLITVSQFARREIAEEFGYPIQRIAVTYEAPDPTLSKVDDQDVLQSVRSRYELPERFLLYLGGTERRKNIETIVRAWAAGRPSGYQLVIVGRFPTGPDPLFPDIPGLVTSMGLSETVQIVPFVESADLAAVYSLSSAFLFPSTYEGFGLPPLEAMACGVPVLAADSTSLPEILGDGAKLLDPNDAAIWRQAMIRVVEDRTWADELSSRGYRRANTFSWAQTAAQTTQIYREVLAE
jgi:glycosyltransferase involved in cell wall biosynthesis